MSLFDLKSLSRELWPVVPGLADAALLRSQRISQLYPGTADVFISPTPHDRIKKDIVCWDASPAVLLWIVVPHGIEVPDSTLESLRTALAADPATVQRQVVLGPALGEPQTGFSASQQMLVHVQTRRPGGEWVTVEDSGDDERIEAAAAATRAAQQERRAQYLSYGRHYTSPSLHPMP